MIASQAARAGSRERLAVCALAVLITLLYGTLAYLRLIRFDLTGFDAGIFDNVLWRIGHGFSDVSALTGFHHFSDHLSPLLLLATPLYAIAPGLGMPVLMFGQAASVALVGVATWLLADHLNLDQRARIGVLLMATIGAGAYNAAVIDVHEVGLALGPLAMTVVLAERHVRPRYYWIWPVLAAAARLDLALSVFLIGWLLRRTRRSYAKTAMWIGGTAFLLMAVWLVANSWEGTSFAFHFAHLDIESATQLPGAMLTHPGTALRPLLDPTMYGTLLVWLAGFTMIAPLRAARWLVPALPTVVIPVLGSWPQADMSHLHYWHVLLPMLAIASVRGFAKSEILQQRAIYLAVGAILITWLAMPIFKPSFGDDLADEQATVDYLAARPGLSVAVPGPLVPHVSQRESVMQLPTPFACPTVPTARFSGPERAPDVVATYTRVIEEPATPAAATLASSLTRYYQLEAKFGEISVWALREEPPASVYQIYCGATDDSANSS